MSKPSFPFRDMHGTLNFYEAVKSFDAEAPAGFQSIEGISEVFLRDEKAAKVNYHVPYMIAGNKFICQVG